VGRGDDLTLASVLPPWASPSARPHGDPLDQTIEALTYFLHVGIPIDGELKVYNLLSRTGPLRSLRPSDPSTSCWRRSEHAARCHHISPNRHLDTPLPEARDGKAGRDLAGQEPGVPVWNGIDDPQEMTIEDTRVRVRARPQRLPVGRSADPDA
jgi:hypothetical protein